MGLSGESIGTYACSFAETFYYSVVNIMSFSRQVFILCIASSNPSAVFLKLSFFPEPRPFGETPGKTNPLL
jgi:hypothetical protein